MTCAGHVLNGGEPGCGERGALRTYTAIVALFSAATSVEWKKGPLW